MIETLRHACLVLFGVTALFLLDVPFKTFGQEYRQVRWRERLVLLTFELDLLILWALAVFLFRWDRRLLPRGAEEALAVLGLLVTLAGSVLTAWAKVRLGRWFTGTFGLKPGHELITDGPYALVRHPMYTGAITLLLGAALAWNSALTLLLALLFALAFLLHTVYEESMFERYFGEAYFDYERRVPRLVPFLRLTPRSRRG